MRKIISAVSVLLLTAVLGGCASMGTGGSNTFVGSLTGSASLSLRNATPCDVVVDVDFRGESLTVQSGEKGILTINRALVSTNQSDYANIGVAVTPLKSEGECDLRAATSTWNVNFRRESNALWIIESQYDRLNLSRR